MGSMQFLNNHLENVRNTKENYTKINLSHYTLRLVSQLLF